MTATPLTVGECYEVLFAIPTQCCDQSLQPDQSYRVDVLLTSKRLIIVRVDAHGQPLDGEKQGHVVRSMVFTAAARRVKTKETA
jgi:hypothetical protein